MKCSRPPAVPSWKLAAAFTPLHALTPLRFLPSSSLSHSMALQSTASSSLPCFQLSPPGKVKQIVGSTLWDSKGAESVLVTNFESDKSAAGFANFYEGDGLISSHVIMLGADPLGQDAAIEALHAYPVCV